MKDFKIQTDLRPVIFVQLGVPMLLLTFGIYHGLIQTLFRAGIIRSTSFLGIEYYQGLTAHGVINAVVLTTLFACAFGNVVISQCLGIRLSTKMAWSSVVVMLLGAVSAAFEIFAGRASVLYTFYPPLKASPVFYSGLALFIVGSWIAFWTWIPAYLRWRKENPGKKVPLAVIGTFATFIIWQMCTLPVAYEVLVLLLPWSLGWTDTVNVMLARTLFWFFGHPLVYFWLLPTYVMYYTVLPKVAGGKLFSDFGGRLAFLLFIVLSSPLGLHHQYADPGISTTWKGLHAVLTSLVAVPSLITAFTVAASLEFAARRNGGTGLFKWWGRLPYLNSERWLFPYLFCGLLIFIFGGVTGVINASYNMNQVVHNTAWIPAHFHLTVGGPVFLGILGMSLMILVGLGGRDVKMPKSAAWVPYIWMFGTFIMSGGQFVGGLLGEPRRTNLGLTYVNPESPAFRPDWWNTTHIAAVGGTIMFLSIVLYFVVLIRSLMQKKSAEKADQFAIPQSESYHDEHVPALMNLRPWVIAGIIAIIVGYTPPLLELYRNNYAPVPGFKHDSPLPAQEKPAESSSP